MIPEEARPNEVAIMRVYLLETYDPKKIAKILHYKHPAPVYRVIRKYRNELSQMRMRYVTGSTMELTSNDAQGNYSQMVYSQAVL